MKVETYEIEEINASEASTMAADSEAIELIEQLGLSGQKTLISPEAATRFPYPLMSAAQLAVFSTLFPDKVEAKEYRQGIIPLRVLQVIAFCKDLPQCHYLEIWHAHAVKEDPILVGRAQQYGSQNYLLARWGDALPTFDEMKVKAALVLAPRLVNEMNRAKAKIDGYISGINEIVAVYLETGDKPSYNVYD